MLGTEIGRNCRQWLQPVVFRTSGKRRPRNVGANIRPGLAEQGQSRARLLKLYSAAPEFITLTMPRLDVPIHSKQIGRIILPLHGRKTRVVFAVAGPEAGIAFVIHHEVRIGALEVEGMHGLPIGLRPLRYGRGLFRIGIDAGNHHRPGRIAAVPGCIAFTKTMDCTIDRIKMHEGQLARRFGRVLKMRINGRVRQLLDKVAAPIPLHALGIEPVEHALHSWVGHRAHPIEQRLRKLSYQGRQGFLAVRLRAVVAGHQQADVLTPNLLRERGARDDLLQADKGSEILLMILRAFLAFVCFSALALSAVHEQASPPQTRTIKLGTLQRSYLVYPPKHPLPKGPGVILAFHGGGGSAASFARVTKLHERAGAEGFVVLYPEGYGRSWNAGDCCGPAQRRHVDDVTFVRAVLDDLRSVLIYDQARVFATGFSTGGRFTYLLACRMSDRLAGIAVVGSAMGIPDTDCTTAAAVPVLHIHGTADTYAPFGGGQSACLGARAAFRSGDRRRMGSAQPVRSIRKAHASTAGSHSRWYKRCRNESEVTLWIIDGLGHQWPGGELVMPRRLGLGTTAFRATPEIVAFFGRQAGRNNPSVRSRFAAVGRQAGREHRARRRPRGASRSSLRRTARYTRRHARVSCPARSETSPRRNASLMYCRRWREKPPQHSSVRSLRTIRSNPASTHCRL